jgi:hypothetical protein
MSTEFSKVLKIARKTRVGRNAIPTSTPWVEAKGDFNMAQVLEVLGSTYNCMQKHLAWRILF